MSTTHLSERDSKSSVVAGYCTRPNLLIQLILPIYIKSRTCPFVQIMRRCQKMSTIFERENCGSRHRVKKTLCSRLMKPHHRLRTDTVDLENKL